jgi:hypothetical protein
MKMKNYLKIYSVIVFSVFINACSTNKNWQDAYVIYSDGYSKNTQIIAKNGSYYTFIRAHSDYNAGKKEILIPEDVNLIVGKDFAFVSMYFDEENYGMESWSFGKVLAGDTIKLAETKFQFKTCACKTAGKFFHGYFLVTQDSHLKIKTDNKHNIYNRLEIYAFVEKYSDFVLPKEINNIEDLINSLENINN